jgi:hypothetical protein
MNRLWVWNPGDVEVETPEDDGAAAAAPTPGRVLFGEAPPAPMPVTEGVRKSVGFKVAASFLELNCGIAGRCSHEQCFYELAASGLREKLPVR